MNQDYYIQLVYQQLSEEITPEAEKELQTWLNSDKQNRRLRQEIELAWTASEGYKEDIQLDLEAEYAQLLQKRDTEARRKISKRRMNWQWSIAASILVFLFAGLLYFLSQNGANTPHSLQYVATEDNSKLQLADGTIVSLQKDAALSYPEKFDSKNRSVVLKGAAFFDVAHNPQKPFEVNTTIGKVQVLGTSFYLTSAEESQTMQLQVVTGKVKMDANGIDQSLVLVAGEQAVADVNANKIAKVKTLPSNDFAWHPKQLVFSDTPLQQTIAAIEAAYGVSIEVETTALNQCPFTATFEPKQPIADVLSVIEQVFEATLLKENENTYRLKGGTCD
ncbi:MAG: FecR family protein [Chitinophagales bacterium]